MILAHCTVGSERQSVALIQRVSAEMPEIAPYLIHVPNGGSRANHFEGWRLKRMGVRKGVSDLFLALPRGGFHGLWIEYKAEPPNDAPLSAPQQEWLDMMAAQGYDAHCCRGIEQAIETLRRYSGLHDDSSGAAEIATPKQ
jgi:hypothetical protein